MNMQTSGASFAPALPTLGSEYLRLFELRRLVEEELHRMIEILDGIDAVTEDREGQPCQFGGSTDIDLDGDIADQPHDEEDEGDAEHDLGWSANASQLRLDPGTDDGDNTAPEREGKGFVRASLDDVEPSLGSADILGNKPQIFWAAGVMDDREGDLAGSNSDLEGGDIDENEGDGNPDAEPSLGAIEQDPAGFHLWRGGRKVYDPADQSDWGKSDTSDREHEDEREPEEDQSYGALEGGSGL